MQLNNWSHCCKALHTPRLASGYATVPLLPPLKPCRQPFLPIRCLLCHTMCPQATKWHHRLENTFQECLIPTNPVVQPHWKQLQWTRYCNPPLMGTSVGWQPRCQSSVAWGRGNFHVADQVLLMSAPPQCPRSLAQVQHQTLSRTVFVKPQLPRPRHRPHAHSSPATHFIK